MREYSVLFVVHFHHIYIQSNSHMDYLNRNAMGTAKALIMHSLKRPYGLMKTCHQANIGKMVSLFAYQSFYQHFAVNCWNRVSLLFRCNYALLYVPIVYMKISLTELLLSVK